jgi:hypothetical protein
MMSVASLIAFAWPCSAQLLERLRVRRAGGALEVEPVRAQSSH